MRFFGLTGNIGCGKSTVASLLATQPDAAVYDCDRIAKDIIRSGEHRPEIQTALGTDVYSTGTANLAMIASIIFHDASRRKALEALIHPLVWERIRTSVEEDHDHCIYIIESATLYESGDNKRCVGVIVATCEPAEQLRRLCTDRHMTPEDIDARRAAQWPMSGKEMRAQFLIRTDGTLDTLRERTEVLYQQLVRHFETGELP